MPPRKNKPTGLLAQMMEGKKANTVILGDAQAYLVKKNAADNSRAQNVIHPSELAKADVCPRQIAYRISGEPPTESKTEFGSQLLLIFEEGHAAHRKWQGLLADMGELEGQWACLACGLRVGGTKPDKNYHPVAEVGYGHHHVWEYREVPLSAYDTHLISGHADGALRTSNAILEIKTIGLGTLRMEEPELVKQFTNDGVVDLDGIWKALNRPLLAHRKQTGVYLALAREMGLPYDKVVFIYEFKATSATKEFVTKYEPDLIEPLLDIAKDIKWAVESGSSLPRPSWAAVTNKTCKGCQWFTHCYSGEEAYANQELRQDAGSEEESRGVPSDGTGDGTSVRPARTAGRPIRTRRQ